MYSDCFIIFCFLLFFWPFCLADTDVEAIMIADVIHAMERPTAVLATLCWSDHKKVALHNVLSGDNVTQINMMQFVNWDRVPKRHAQDQHIVFLADLNCPNISSYLQMSNTEKHFRSPFRWILLDDSQDSSVFTIPKEINQAEILIDSEVMVASRITDRIYYLHYVYKVNASSDWRTEYYGSWNPSVGIQTEQFVHVTAIRRLDLQGFAIKVSYVTTNEESVGHLEDGIDDHIDTITKTNFPTTNHLLDFLNASRMYVFADTWGYKINGTWNGLTGCLVRNEVEIGGSPMFLTEERMPVVDFVSSPTPTRSKFVFQQPKLSTTNNLFLLSFRTTVWYSSLGLVFLTFLALVSVAKWEWIRNTHSENTVFKDSGRLRGNIQDVALLIFGATCQQGSPVELKGSLGRTVMLILFLSLMFLYTSYSANIVALLQSSSTQIRTLEDLLHSRLKFGVHDNVFNRYYFSHATEPIRKAIYQTKVAPKGGKSGFMSMEEGVQNMRKGLFAFHMETGVGYKFVGKFFHEGEKCGLKEIQYLQVIDPWTAVRKNTPFKEMFKIGFKRIQEHGLQKRENQRFYAKRPKCSGSESNFVSVSMVDCYPALLVLTYGIFLSVFFLFIEILLKKRENLLHVLCRRHHSSAVSVS